LVYPHFETGDWTPGYRIDKAHADALQVLVTQGAIGLAAYLALLGANLLMFWKARRIAAMPSLFAGFVGYELVTQVNFSWLPAALPFWIFLGAAFVMARGDERGPAVVPLKPLAWRSAVGLTSVLSLALLVPLVLQPYRGEGLFSSGLQAEVRGETATALSRFDGARRVSPENATYYAAEGNLLLMNGRFRESRNLLAGAVALGSEDASAQRSLQIIEELSRGAGN
jgi:O-antigen ligase